MKTISRIMLVLGLLIAIAGTNSFAQTSLSQLQAMETALNSDIATLQTDISALQAGVTAIDAQIAEANSNGDDVAALDAQRQELLDEIVLKQNTLVDKQVELLALQGEIANVTAWNNQHDRNWIVTNTPPPAPYNAANNITNVADPNNPGNQLMFFVPTGNSTLDEQLVHQWLLQRGLVDY
jgi:hypothetical protein